MVGLIITLLVAALAYILLTALGLPSVIGIVAAILILVAGIPLNKGSWRGSSRSRA